jgi:hypothetical protein
LVQVAQLSRKHARILRTQRQGATRRTGSPRAPCSARRTHAFVIVGAGLALGVLLEFGERRAYLLELLGVAALVRVVPQRELRRRRLTANRAVRVPAHRLAPAAQRARSTRAQRRTFR